MVYFGIKNDKRSQKMSAKIKIAAPKKREITVSVKITAEQDEKLRELAEKLDMKKSTLIYELIGIGYKAAARRKAF